ncbi:MAG: DUF2200 domain-containing protein [Acidimicrobiales bacterium]
MATSTESTAVPKALQRIYGMSFGLVYPMYVEKAEKKDRTKREVDKVIRWLTGYTQRQLMAHVRKETSFETFFAEAPSLNPDRSLITGVVCGVRVENVEEPTLREIRYLDKLIDELAKGKAMEKILRGSVDHR